MWYNCILVTLGLFDYILVLCQDLVAFVLKKHEGKIFRTPQQENPVYISAKQKIQGIQPYYIRISKCHSAILPRNYHWKNILIGEINDLRNTLYGSLQIKFLSYTASPTIFYCSISTKIARGSYVYVSSTMSWLNNVDKADFYRKKGQHIMCN